LKTREATRPRSPPAPVYHLTLSLGREAAYDVDTRPVERFVMKKLLVILILVAIGVAVAKKVRDSA
jgi:hypothetical protein